jgi:hypothetical protein
MHKVILMLMACLFLAGCAGTIDKKLIVTWKSNRDKSVSECLRRAPYRQEMKPEKKKSLQIFSGIWCIHLLKMSSLLNIGRISLQHLMKLLNVEKIML